jgi:hypothetical protein
MGISSIHHVRINRLAAMALLALLITQLLEPRWAAAAASDDGFPVDQVSMSYGKVTLRYGQTLRLNLTSFSVDHSVQSSQPTTAIRAAAQLKDTSGNTIYISTQGGGVWKTVDGGQSCSFDVNRDELPLAGDSRTGALAVVPELMIQVPAGVRPDFPISLEVTDNHTGAVVFVGGWGCSTFTHEFDGGYIHEISGSLCSVTRGETLQVNLSNPLPLTLANQPVAGIDYSITIKGIVGESSDVRTGRINPGQTIVARFNRDRLPDAGDPGTGRLSLAPEITYTLRLTPEQLAALGEVAHFPVSFEIVANAAGNVTAHFDSYYGRGVYKTSDSGRTW